MFMVGEIMRTYLTASAAALAFVVSAGVASAATFVLLQFATLHLPSAKVMAYTYLTPSWVILWEMALGHGAPVAWVLGGVALTVVALLVLLRDEEPQSKNPSFRSASKS